MDIYRIFHPHHNPRLLKVPLRQHELSELEQVASELRYALKRARQRCVSSQASSIRGEHFDELIRAALFIECTLDRLIDSHEGDSESILLDLVHEREEFPGWENWANIVREYNARKSSEKERERNYLPVALSNGGEYQKERN